MRVAALIPARGGSKRLHRKNLLTVGGRPLVYRAIAAAQDAGIKDVTVSTDDPEIELVADCAGAKVHRRPPELASDSAQIEPTIEHWWRGLEPSTRPDVIVLLQPTSPLRTHETVRACVDLLVRGGYSAVCTLTRVPPREFLGRLRFRENGDPRWISDRPIAWRPRSQDCNPTAREDGCVYAFTAEHWRKAQNRLAEPDEMSHVIIDPTESIDIDTEEDLRIAEAIEAAR